MRFSKKINAATRITNQPNAILSFSAFTRAENIDPTTEPTGAPTMPVMKPTSAPSMIKR